MADVEIRQFKNKRAVIKGKLTRFGNYLQSLDNEEINNTILAQVTIRLEKLHPLLEEFNVTQAQIENLTENIENEVVERENFETTYFDVITSFKLFIASSSPGTVGSTPALNKSLETISLRNLDINAVNSESNGDTTGHVNINSVPGVSQNNTFCSTNHQPLSNQQNSLSIKLPSFNGNYDHWLEFCDTFTSMVHNDPRLDDIKKFLYLKASVTGEAKDCIKSIVVSAANYPIAWNLLRDRFENKEILIHNHIKALFDLPVVYKESHTALRHLLDSVLKNIRCLSSLGEPVDQWDRLLIQFVCIKLDSVTKREWKESSNSLGHLPTFTDLTLFLQKRCELLETLDLDKTHIKQKTEQKQIAYTSVINQFCVFCKGSHIIYNCNEFLKLSTDERIAESKKLKICLNCLRKNHFIKDCHARNCFKCGKKHNTLLHIDNVNKDDNSVNFSVQSSSRGDSLRNNPPVSLANHTTYSNNAKQILLSTAIIQVADNCGKWHSCRCLLDSGSQCNFISEELCSLLGLKKDNFNSLVLGINQGISNITHKTEVQIQSNINAFSAMLPCLVLPGITENLPTFSFDPKMLKIPQNLKLADSSFNISSKIDLLLGATVFWKLLCVGQVDLGKDLPTLQNTQFGWIISGSVPMQLNKQKYERVCAYNSIEVDNLLHEQVVKFWNIEECNGSLKNYSREEKNVEEHFLNTVQRDINGRFIVSIPLKENVAQLGETRSTALNRFYNMEKRLIKYPDLRREYVKFMNEYKQLGHMTKINEIISIDSKPTYYLPHHSVIKQESITTKVRVVFDGSCKSSSGLSLNDVQNIGPTIQNDLLTILLNFRKYSYALNADIAKMYRQVLLNPADS